MGNCTSISSGSAELKTVSKKQKLLPIDSTFIFTAPLPSWPPGGGFAMGTIDLGGLILAEVTTFNKVWTIYKGGPDNAGATFFEPTGLPQGFCILGYYAQPNNRALFGSVLVGKDATTDSNPAPAPALTLPTDYALVWSSQSLKVKQDSSAYIWAPVPPNGYNAVGLVVTTTSDKPPLDKVRCVRSDLTAPSEPRDWIWGPKKDAKVNDFNIYKARPTSRGIEASAVSISTFMVQNSNESTQNDVPLIACLTNASTNLSCMPNLDQIKTLIETYSPKICMHPDEEFLPSSVDWFFTNGALLYKKDDESNPVPINPSGSNLPQGGPNDGSYWIGLPRDNEAAGESLKKGNLESATAYIQIKPMLGGTHTDIAIWQFYPFNGPARAKVGALNIPLGKIGEHVGDWEHVTLRISNFNGMLKQAYFSQHSSGKWVEACDLEFREGNKFVAYSSLHGHGNYPRPGLEMQGTGLVGIRNDTAKSHKTWDTGSSYRIVSADYLGEGVIEEPHWLNYTREWGPRIRYDLATEIDTVAKSLTGKTKTALLNTVKSLPNEVLGEQGPTGPKMKNYWYGDER